jgi:ribulose-phosphate 3-epimerase
MVTNPGKIIRKFIQAGAEWISFHLETAADEDVLQNIQLIKKSNSGAGLVLNPDTEINRVKEYLPYLDYVLLMSVYPGYGGQSFIPDTLDRVRELKQMIVKGSLPCLIQVDGGINTEIARQLARAGADLFVIGTCLFNSDNIIETASKIRQQCEGD